MEIDGKPSKRRVFSTVALVAGAAVVAGATWLGADKYFEAKNAREQREIQVKGNEAERYLGSVGRVALDGVIYDIKSNTVTFKDVSKHNPNSVDNIGDCEGPVVTVDGQTQVGELECTYRESAAIGGAKPAAKDQQAPAVTAPATKGGLPSN